MKPETALSIAKKYLKGKRLEHSISTAKLAARLGKNLELDTKKLYLAGMLHDIAKPFNSEEMLKIAKKFNIKIDAVFKNNISLLHAPVAAALVKKKYNLNDTDIINSIANHTTGISGMSLFEQIIYAADFLDPARSFPEQEKGWKLLSKDFYECIFYINQYTIKKILKKNKVLHVNSVYFYNETLSIINDKKHIKIPIRIN